MDKLTQNPLFFVALAVLGPLLKDFAVVAMRRLAHGFRSDKDPKNDGAAVLLDSAADAIERLRVQLPRKK